MDPSELAQRDLRDRRQFIKTVGLYSALAAAPKLPGKIVQESDPGFHLHNAFWEIQVSANAPMITSLGFDARGGGKPCANLLKTSSALQPKHLIATICGAQSGYLDSENGLYLSSGCRSARGRQTEPKELQVERIEYGQVRENWRLRLEGQRLVWVIEQTWLEDCAVADAFVPGFFFSPQSKWGEATVFQLWNRNTRQDAFYGLDTLLTPESTPTISRSVSAVSASWGIAKLLSHARPNGDLRVKVSHHLKKGEIWNQMSVLAHTPRCEPVEPTLRRAGEKTTLTIVLEPDGSATGAALAVELNRAWNEPNATNRRFFDTYANCAILADTHAWRFGNEPSGVICYFCSYLRSEMLKFGVLRGELGPDCMDPHRVMVGEVEFMANNVVTRGTVGGGYLADTALDLLPSFLISLRDALLLTGDRELGRRLWQGGRLALEKIAARLALGDGLIATDRNDGNDYWDWIRRNGRILYVNELTYLALRASAEVANWLGDISGSGRAGGLADRLRARFNEEFWNEDRGYCADWVDRDRQAHFFLYAGPQLQAITAGMFSPARARRIVEGIIARRKELGAEWTDCFSLQTNFFDAEAYSSVFRDFHTDVTRFGQTMNGGCLVSWNYYWIGALVKVGLVNDAIQAWHKVVRRFGATSLVEGCNYWDFAGRPSRTTFTPSELISYEPFLSDQGLVSAALPRWLLGIEPAFYGVAVAPVLPASAYPATVKLLHLGTERTIVITNSAPYCAFFA